MNADELTHLIKQIVGQQTDSRSFVYGRISSWDQQLNRVKLSLQSIRDENDNPVVTPWVPLGTMWAGNGFGMQVAPIGGEQCVLMLLEKNGSVAATAFMTHNSIAIPPGNTAIPNPNSLATLSPPLSPGECVLMNPSGSYIRFWNQDNGFVGPIEINTQGDVYVNSSASTNVVAGTEVNITTEFSNISIFSGNEIMMQTEGGQIQIGNDALQAALTAAAAELYNSHTHPAPGGTTGAPNQTMGAGQMTTTLQVS